MPGDETVDPGMFWPVTTVASAGNTRRPRTLLRPPFWVNEDGRVPYPAGVLVLKGSVLEVGISDVDFLREMCTKTSEDAR